MFRISGDINFEILVEDSDTGGPSLITVRIECLFAFQFWYCELCVKNQWGGWAESIILLVFIWCGYFSYRWLRGGGVGQKVIFRSSWNRIFCLLLRLKSRTAWGAFHRPAFMVWCWSREREGLGESKILFCYPRGLRASPQIYRGRGGLIYCVWSICRWLSQWWLVFVLLRCCCGW